MALFEIAQTRTGKNMTGAQVITEIQVLIEDGKVGVEPENEYYVKNYVAVINYALDILGIDEDSICI